MKILKKNLSLLIISLIIFLSAVFTVEAKTTFRNFIVDFDTSSRYIRICEYLGSEKNVEIPDDISGYNVHYIDSDAFIQNENIETVKMPYYLTNIGSYAFYGCSSLDNVEIPLFVTSIGDRAFANCTNLKNITINGNITSISNYMFDKCTSLTSVTLPETVNTIGNYAFRNCSNLKTINLPSNITSIASNAFVGCNNLTVVAPEGSYAHQYCVDNNFKFRPIDVVLGDVNKDNRVNIQDVTYIQKYLAGMDGFDIEDNTRTFYATDVDGDEQIDIGDASLIFRLINHEISVFPVEE